MMKPKRSLAIVAAMAVASLLPLPCTAQQDAVPAILGEEYFLVRLLEKLYENWPIDAATPEEFAAASAQLRAEAIRLRERAAAASVDQSIVRAYADLISQMDRQTSFLVELGAIRRAEAFEQGKDSFSSGYRGGYAGASAFTILDGQENLSTKDAAIAAVVIGAVSYAVDAWGKASQRDASERAAISAAVQALQDEMTATLERTRQSFQQLATMRGWKQSEIGWDLSPQFTERVQRVREKGDLAGLGIESARQRQERPSDFFARIDHGHIQALQAKDAATLGSLAEDAYASLSFVPEAPVYNDYRLEGMIQAALLMNGALLAEQRSAESVEGFKLSSKRAVEWWEEICRIQPSDPTGDLGHCKAMAYALNGDFEMSLDCLTAVTELKSNDGGFLYMCAWVLSQTGDLDLSLEVLTSALRMGGVAPGYVRADPLLVSVREGRAEEFDRLTLPQWTWDVVEGVIFADVTVTNHSPFILTDVRLESKIFEWNPDLKTESLAPGQKKTWYFVAKPPQGRKDILLLRCSENPRLPIP